MEIEELKVHLGDELYEQVSEKLSGVDNLRVINTASGAWIPKAKFEDERKAAKELQANMQSTIDTLTHEAEERETKAAQTLRDRESVHTKKLAEATAAVEETRSKLQAEIDKLTADAQTKATEFEALKTDLTSKAGTIAELTKTVAERENTISSLYREAKERRLIRASGARDEDVVLKLIDQGKVSEGENGSLVGLSEQLEDLKKSSGYLFSREHAQRGGFTGGKEQTNVKQPATADVNAAIRAAFGR